MSKVLFVGDINVDIIMGGLKSLPITDREIACDSFEITMGSTAVFTACAYAMLGGDSSFLGLAGNDDYGRFMIAGMERWEVNTDLVRFSNTVKTGVTLNLIHKETRTQITYPGTIAELQSAHIDTNALHGFDHVHFAGIYQQYKLQPELTGLLKMLKRQRITASLDPQWDEHEQWEDMQAWLPLLTYLFVNEDEAVSITGADSVENAWKALADETPCPLVKLGKQGCLVKGKRGMTRIPAFAVNVVDTVGAGDAFGAGFLFGVQNLNMPPAEAARFGNAVGARNCMVRGGINEFLSYQGTRQFMEEQAS